MKNKFDLRSMLLGAFLSAAILLSVAAVTSGRSTVLEYKVLRTYAYHGQFEKTLNELALEGWSVVSSSTTVASVQSEPHAVVILQRPKK